MEELLFDLTVSASLAAAAAATTAVSLLAVVFHFFFGFASVQTPRIVPLLAIIPFKSGTLEWCKCHGRGRTRDNSR
jgi:hypothetical protein